MLLRSAQHRPLVGLATAVAAGCVCGLRAGFDAWFFLAASAIAAAAALFLRPATRRGRALRAAAMLGAAFLLAAARAAGAAARERARTDALRTLGGSRVLVAVVGTLETEPVGFALPQGGGRLSFRMRVKDISVAEGASEPPSVPFDLDVDFYGPVSLLGEAASRPAPEAGEGWRFEGRIQSREVSYRREPLLSLHASVRDPHARAAEADSPTWRRTLWDVRRATARHLSFGLAGHPEAAAVLRAVLLGYRAEIPQEVRAFFADSGTVHLFAISGLHIMLVAGFLRWILLRIGVPWRACGLVVIPALVAYTVLTGGRPSAWRACLMTTLFCAAPLFRRRADPVSSLAAAAVLLLAADPTQVTDLGFAFSFASVLGILLLAPPLETLLSRALRRPVITQTDELEERALRLQTRIDSGSLRNRVRRSILFLRVRTVVILVRGLAVSFAAWAVAEPITASVFGQQVPVSVLSNLVVIPMGTWSVRIAATGLGVGVVWPTLGVLFNRVAGGLVEAMIWTTGLFARIPGGHASVEPWTLFQIVAWYAAVGILAFALHVQARRLGKGVEENYELERF